MAADALGAGAANLVMVVLGHIEFCRHMALAAQCVALGAQFQAVRVVAIGAGDACVIHAALHKRAVFVNLAVDLPVGVIEPCLQ
jgi:hypothetical protein